MWSAILAVLPLLLKVLGWMFDRGIEKGKITKEQAEKYIKDVQAIASKLDTAAKLRDDGISQSDELDAWEKEQDKPKEPTQ